MSASADDERACSDPTQQRWPDRLRVAAVDPSARDRVHGYSLSEDLVHHYAWSDYAYLCIAGALPTDMQLHAFKLALFALSAARAGSASIHGSALAKTAHAPHLDAIAVGALILSEEARGTIEEHEMLVRWAVCPDEERPPQHYRACDAQERRSVASVFSAARAAGIDVRSSVRELSLTATGIVLLVHSGLRQTDQLATATFLARLPTICGEIGCARPGELEKYPFNVPSVEYLHK